MDRMKKKVTIDWKKLEVEATHVPKVKNTTLVKLCDFFLHMMLVILPWGAGEGVGRGLKQPSPNRKG